MIFTSTEDDHPAKRIGLILNLVAHNEQEYGPFGEVIRATGPLAKVDPLRFSTKYQDDETDLLWYGHRYLGTFVGRWLSVDPVDEPGFIMLVGDEPEHNRELTSERNLYGFVGNHPTDKIDVLGLAFYAIDGT